MKKILSIVFLLALPFSLNAKEELFIYNWSDYIAEDTIANFEAETGIQTRMTLIRREWPVRSSTLRPEN